MGNEQGRPQTSRNSKDNAKEYFYLRHGYQMWEDASDRDDEHVEELTPLKVGLLKKVGTKSKVALTREVSLWTNRIEYSLISKDWVGFVPTFGASVSAPEGEPLQLVLRDGFGGASVDHVFLTETPVERDVWVEAISQAIRQSTPLDLQASASAGQSTAGSISGNENENENESENENEHGDSGVVSQHNDGNDDHVNESGEQEEQEDEGVDTSAASHQLPEPSTK